MNILVPAVVSLITLLGIFNLVPLDIIDLSRPHFGTSVTTIQGSDTLSASRSVINTNFSNLNDGKIENSSTTINAITTLTNLASVGTITSGTWSGSTIAINKGGTNSTSFTSGKPVYYDGTSIVSTSTLTTNVGGTSTTTHYSGGLFFSDGVKFTQASSTGPGRLFWDNTAGRLGIGSSTPLYALSVGSYGLNFGSIVTTENKVSTSTNITIDWRLGNQQLVQMGTAATTISFTNQTAGATMRVVACNPTAAAGALTFSGVEWSGAAAPTQNTTANYCNVYSFIATQATSTTGAIKIFGSGSMGFD